MVQIEKMFILNRSLDPERTSLDCWADGWLWVRRRSGLRREQTSNKMPTRKWKMTGSYLLHNELYYNGLMTDLGWRGAMWRKFTKKTWETILEVSHVSIWFPSFRGKSPHFWRNVVYLSRKSPLFLKKCPTFLEILLLLSLCPFSRMQRRGSLRCC